MIEAKVSKTQDVNSIMLHFFMFMRYFDEKRGRQSNKKHQIIDQNSASSKFETRLVQHYKNDLF